jgi:ribosomal protein L34
MLGQGWWSNAEIALDEENHSYPACDEDTQFSKQYSFILPSHIERGKDYSARIRMKTENGLEVTSDRSGKISISKSDTPML